MSDFFKAYCPLDCFDTCSFNVYLKDGKIHKLAGDKNHEYTSGFLCGKAEKLIERMYSPDRLLTPLRRKGASFEKISWQQALEEIAERLTAAKQKFGPTSVMYYTDEGSAGILKALEKRFFHAFGGATFTKGTLCWDAACGAQKRDFGEYRAHLWEDMLNSKTIVLWGRNVAVTNLHMVPIIRKAQQKGARVITIDPNRTQTAAFSDEHLAIKPGTDGVFALGVAHIILKNSWADLDYISKHVINFEQYLNIVKEYTPEVTAQITGLSEEAIQSFAARYARSKPACIWLGYGMQRYTDSGQTVRAINAIGAITGNIGISGGGVNHASQFNKKILNDISGAELGSTIRLFKKAKTAEEIPSADPPVEVLFVTAANPAVQLPNTNKVMQAFHSIPFKVVSDFFLTETARLADVVLPCASVFEKEDVIVSSWNPYIGYNRRLVHPRGEAKADYEIFQELAKLLHLENFGDNTPEQWLEQALEPVRQYGISLDKLRDREQRNPFWENIPWKDGEFLTPSGKFELLDKFSPLREQKGLRLLTVHHTKTLNSQFYNLLEDMTSYPYVYVSPALAERMYLRDLEKVQLQTEAGEMTGLVQVSENIYPDCVVVHEGSWLSCGGGVNLLTQDVLTDFGNGAAYNEVFCKLQKII